ncbi:hypothetical protein Taro_018369, partial [Colocasia esculenta]|nr:hypothetical protein [Colocasia esculenta]
MQYCRDPLTQNYKCLHGERGRILPTGTRDSTLEILVGEDGWVTHHENGILYSFDASKCMFSSGNFSEKLRIARLDCKDEVIVDLFAGIGYFVLPFLVRARARFVYACEWNPHALEALRHNLKINLVADRCHVLEGDSRMTAPKVANPARLLGQADVACDMMAVRGSRRRQVTSGVGGI